MATIYELWSGIDGSQDEARIRYLVRDATSYTNALDQLELDAPFEYDGMPREDIQCREVSKKDGLYYGTSIYTRRSGRKPAPDTNAAALNVTNPAEEDPDKELFSFDVSVQPELVVQTDDVLADQIQFDGGNAGPGGSYAEVPVVGIGYDLEDGYRGTQILKPHGSFSLDLYPEDSKVTRTYQNLVMDSVGKVNSDTFRKYVAGELLLSSARGESRNGADWRISLTFRIKKARSNVNLGNGVAFASVDGWDYIDAMWVKRVFDLGGGEKALNILCRQAIVWRLYKRTAFASLIV